MTGHDPETSFVQRSANPEIPGNPGNPGTGTARIDLDELRKTWGTGADAKQGLSAAMGVASQVRRS